MFKLLAVFFLLFILTVVASADTGIGDHVYSFVFAVPFGDKIGHFLLMGTLSLLVNLALGARTVQFGRYDILLGSLLVAIGITLEELSQIWIVTRSFSLLDLAANYAGIWIFGRIAIIIHNAISDRQRTP